MSNSKQTKLPNTAYAVLGILSMGDALSGYEIRKWAETLRFFYWSPAQSQIYAELRRLAKLGLATSEEIPQEGKPDKRVYQITDVGREAFRTWINNQPLEPIVMKHSLALRLFFGQEAEEGRLEELLIQFIAEIKEGLAQLYIVEEFMEHHPQFSHQSLVALWGQNFYKAELATAEEVLARLREKI